MRHPLRHHGDREVRPGMLDFAVNVHQAPMPPWLHAALTDSLQDLARYPDPSSAEAALAAQHGRDRTEVLATSGAAEAFTLIARLRSWRHPVVIHPQFTEPDVALSAAGHLVDHVLLGDDFALNPGIVPEDADLVIVGNPTNPTGVRHRRTELLELRRPGRLIVVDEAFCDDDDQSVTRAGSPGVVVIRSLTKLWAIAGLRAGYLLGEPAVLEALRQQQPPWSVSAPAVAAMLACTSSQASHEAAARMRQIQADRTGLERGLADLGIHHISSTAPFVLARPGVGVHGDLREQGIAVRRCDTFPGLDESWIRIAVRSAAPTRLLLDALSKSRSPR